MSTDYGFGLASDEQINNGDVTDAYFVRTEEALEQLGSNPHVYAEITADQFSDGESEVFCGLKEALHLLEGLPVDVFSMPEGESFDGGAVMAIEGNYRDFARFETPLLGLLSQASGYATVRGPVRIPIWQS